MDVRKLLANRGKSSARPVRLDGLQILAESELFDSKSRDLTCELLSITAWNLPASREFGKSKQKRQLRRLPVIYKRFKLQKKDLLRYGIFHIFAKIDSPYAKMGGTSLYPILESQTV